MSGSVPQPVPRLGQVSADHAKGKILSFARAAGLRDAAAMTVDTANPARPCQDCYPSLTLLPGPRWTGHFLVGSESGHRQSPAASRRRGVFRFRRGQKLLNCPSITTLIRGSLTCVNLFFSPLFPRRLQLVWPMTASALWSVQPPVQRLPQPPMVTCLPVQSLAVPPAPSVMKSPTSASSTLAALHGAFEKTAIRGTPRVVVLHSAAQG